MRTSIVPFAVALAIPASAQLDSAFTLSGYAEVYYSYELSNPDNHLRQGPFYSFNRHNEVSLNMGYAKLAYAKNNVRGNLALMAGTYAQYNLAAEPELLRSVFEANVGVKLSKTRELWIDAGIMPSHIGFESAIGADSWNVTRSLLAENSPYYEAGLKLGYTSRNAKWYAAGMMLNGWQRIARPEGNNTPAFGTQLTFKPSDKLMVNWSTFVGNEMPDSVSQMRYFSNLYAQLQITEGFGLTAGFDYGMQEASTGDSSSMWMSPVLIPRFQLSERSWVAGRWELYQDADGVIVGSTGTPNGFNTMGYSINFDRRIGDNVLWRIEARALNSQDKIFADDKGGDSPSNVFFTTSLSIRFP
ncbi:MAG: porin [Flavobacteriales bacterium]|nr:porin [Flavobacteriales bacterium]